MCLRPSHLWRDDVKQISCYSVFLSEDVVLIRFKGDAIHVDDEGAGRQVKGDAVLSQEALQLGGLLPQKLQGHFRAWKAKAGNSYVTSNPIPRFLFFANLLKSLGIYFTARNYMQETELKSFQTAWII